MPQSSMKPLNYISTAILNNKPINSKFLRFIILGDSHVIINTNGSLGKNAYLYKKIMMIVNYRKDNNYFNPDFIIHGGDTVDNGNDKDSFELFWQLTYNELIHKGIPVFVSMGNHDYDITKCKPDSKNFEKFIGKTRDEIHIPGTNVRYIHLNTHNCFKPSASQAVMYSYFSSRKNEDIDLLKKMNSTDVYLIDFHNPFRLKDSNGSLPPNDFNFLQWDQRNLFKNSIDSTAKICAIFSHHMHTMRDCKLDFNNRLDKIPFLISGKGGNCKNSIINYGSYYEIILDLTTNDIQWHQITIPL